MKILIDNLQILDCNFYSWYLMTVANKQLNWSRNAKRLWEANLREQQLKRDFFYEVQRGRERERVCVPVCVLYLVASFS